MDEIIYILINGAMPGYVKIGRTTDLEQRIRSLDTTGIPIPFECFYACTVSDANFVERQLHDAFLDHRVRSSREFFELSPERVLSALKLAEIENVTPKKDYVESEEDQQVINQAKTKRSRFNFKLVGIQPGEQLTFINDENVKVTVIDNRNVEYSGESMSLSRSAQQALSVEYPVSGPLYWMYKGETLDERRIRIEDE
jgi:hypothetical protein